MTVQVISTVLAAVAALFAAVSSFVSLRATRAIEEDVRLARAATKHNLFRSFEADLAKQYDSLWQNLGPWDDGLPAAETPRPTERRAVHDLLQTLSSIYLAGKLGLLEPEQRRYAELLFLDWLATPKARHVWESIFRKQTETWPPGFPAWVDAALKDLPASAPATTDEGRSSPSSAG